MTNEEKLEKLKSWLDSENIEWRVPKRKGSRTSLVVDKFHMFIKVSDEHDQEWYLAHMAKHPVFIRDNDSVDFVIEKVQNTIIKVMQAEQKQFMKRKK